MLNVTTRDFQLALADAVTSMRKSKLWLFLGWSEIRLKYRRSTLGPWWITLSMAIFVAAMGVVYSRLFHQDVLSYLPFLICGMLVWMFISSSVIESSMIFKNSQGFIKQVKLPYFTYPLKFLFMNTVILLHNFVVYLILLCLSHIELSWHMLLALPGFILLAANVLWVSILLALIGTRFRDIPQIINSLVQVVFFISPITWLPKLVGENSLILKLNPVVYLLDIVRSPLLGQLPAMNSWITCISMCIVGSLFTFMMFAKYRSRIPFWIE